MDGAQIDGSDFRGALGLTAAQVCSGRAAGLRANSTPM